jgi:DNA-directed RNA polymerase subunit alpha
MIQLLQKTKIISQTPQKAIIQIEGVYPGYGITLGNALRRVLLSSLEGAAVTSFRVVGVAHEFSTLPGVYEDVIQISLNLKKLRFRVFSDEPQTLRVVAKGEKKITAADMGKNAQVEIVNPESPMVTLTDAKASLEMELIVERGIGYVLAEKRKRKEKLPIGTIELDANFSPVVRANVLVENMMVGERTDYNRVKLEIDTDGSLDPVEAFHRAVDILIEQFNALKADGSAKAKETESTFAVLEKKEDIKAIPLENAKLSVRTINVLTKHRIKVLGDLEGKAWEKIKDFQGMGEKGLEELKAVAKEYGLNIK